MSYTLTPKSTSHADLEAHAKGLARELKLTREQTEIVVSEIRNAISPAAMTAFRLGSPEDVASIDAEELRDLKVSLSRVLALMTALDRVVR